MKSQLIIEPGNESVTGHCDSCGHESRIFRGFVYEQDQAFGIYVGSYTQSHPELGVSMAVSLRGWGVGANKEDKECVVLEWRVGQTGPGCAVIDAPYSMWSGEKNLGRMLSREEALVSGRAKEAFAVADVVWVSDTRLEAALVPNSALQPTLHASGAPGG